MKKPSKQGKILITGSAGFIGFHLAETLLAKGHAVVGVDSLSPYYDVRIKIARTNILKKYPKFTFIKQSIADYNAFEKIVRKEKPSDIVHLAAQAGVRYSLVDPWTYADANYLGTLNVFEAARRLNIQRVMYASSSSVYGTNRQSPFKEEHRTDHPGSMYAATKKANEVLAEAYHHLFGREVVGLRFFTVYGPWGRPDMALFKFVRNITQGKPIQVYNRGNMKRSFTYITDVVAPIVAMLETPPVGKSELYNLGGSEAVPLKKFVSLIETKVGKKAKKILLPLQQGDRPESIADCSKAKKDWGYTPRVPVEEGVARFVDWFSEHKTFLLSLKEPKQ